MYRNQFKKNYKKSAPLLFLRRAVSGHAKLCVHAGNANDLVIANITLTLTLILTLTIWPSHPIPKPIPNAVSIHLITRLPACLHSRELHRDGDDGITVVTAVMGLNFMMDSAIIAGMGTAVTIVKGKW